MIQQRNKRICDVVNPPIPTSATADTISGQKLLSLLKTYDKCKQRTLQLQLKDTDDKDSISGDDDVAKVGVVVEEIIHILQQLTIIAQRQGLLRRNNSNNNSNTTMAKHVLDSISMTDRKSVV